MRRGSTYSTASDGETSGRNVWRERDIKTLNKISGGVRNMQTCEMDNQPMHRVRAAREEINPLYRAKPFIIDVDLKGGIFDGFGRYRDTLGLGK
jgi:hypothetical protein